jgi:nitrous oxidase accessory protein NosD
MMWILIATAILLTGSTTSFPLAHAQTQTVIEVHGGSLQAAIDSANPGDIIEVYSGTYTEQLNIVKPLTIYASAGSLVTISSPPAGSRKTPLSIAGSSNLWDPIVQIHDTNNVGFLGFIIDGNSQGSPSASYAGVLVYQATQIYVSGNEVKNIYSVAGLSTGSTGFGIVVLPGASTSYTLLSTNDVHDYNNAGIVVSGQGASALVYENWVTGSGTTSITAQDGIQFSNGAYGKIVFNTISFNGPHTGSTSTVSAGILISNSKGFPPGQLAQYNTFIGNQVNILVT